MSVPTGLMAEGLALVLGLVVGSFINVLALRALSEESILWPPSHCPQCKHRLSALDNIPLISYVLLKGRCRHCHGKISIQYPLVEAASAVMFLLLFKVFGFSWYCLGMLLFGCTLIAVCITDLREKLIPHDITYPSMLMGLLFSGLVRHDPLGSLAGIGASYILFDFLAHYGLKIYSRFRVADNSNSAQERADDQNEWRDQAIDESFQLSEAAEEKSQADEIEVMGGGDAVLSAVISAWLGWQRLVVALVIGFLVGTVMGLIYLIREMRAAGILRESVRPTLIGAVAGFVVMAMPWIFLQKLYDQIEVSWQPFAWLGAAGGATFGLVSVGTRVSKPFPFGPALAIGGFVAIFWEPIGWLLKGGA